DNPVLFFEHKRLYGRKGPVHEEVVPIGVAAVVRPGTDVTIVSAMKTVHDCLAAAETLAGYRIDAEVIDLRTVRPLDIDTIAQSVEKTGRLLVVEEGPRTGGWAGEGFGGIGDRPIGAVGGAGGITPAETPKRTGR